MLADTPPSMDLAGLRAVLAAAADEPALLNRIVNAPFLDARTAAHLGLGIVVLLLVDNTTQMIERVALSDTPSAVGAVRMSAKPFHDIRIPRAYPHNLIAKAIQSNTPQQTADWKHLFMPDLTPQDARMNQAGAGIECSVIYPLGNTKNGGALIFSYFEPPELIGETHGNFMRAYAKMVGEQLAAIGR